MSKQKKALITDTEAELLNNTIVDAIQDIKGKNIVIMDLRSTDDSPTDFFIVCEGDSVTQTKAISDSVNKKVYEHLSIQASHIEGTTSAKWILVDFFTTVVHIFYPETRAFYDIEDLWSDARTIEVANIS